jgi:hypothetical protein
MDNMINDDDKIDDGDDDLDEAWLSAPMTPDEEMRAEHAAHHNPFNYDMDTCKPVPNAAYRGAPDPNCPLCDKELKHEG